MDTDALLTSTLDPSLLPDDLVVLKTMIMQLIEELHKAQSNREQLEHRIDLLLKRLYGSRSEKFDPRQGTLFDLQADGEAAESETAVAPPEEVPPEAKPSPRRHRHGRGRIPENIERVEVRHALTEAEIAAMGGRDNTVELPSDTSEQLDYIPSSLRVTVHIFEKRARKVQLLESGLTPAEQNVVVASKPPEAIPGALATPGMMAQVIVCKGVDHLPLHRQENIWKRQGVHLSRQTMCDWWLRTGEYLQPLYQLMIRVVLASHVIHTDDTLVNIRDAKKKQKCKGYFWPYVGDARHALTVFDFTTTHQRAGPAKFLKDYCGYLQADAFNGYDGIYLESLGRIIEVACWSHSRRKYYECRRLDAARMHTALAWIRQLYAVESDLRARCAEGGAWEKLDLDERASLIVVERQERSRPLLNSFHDWLQTESPKVLPKSPVLGAMNYSLSNWAALNVYTEDGWLDIDNNEGENSLRGLCIGRRNWLFVGSERGGHAAAVHFSLLASCKRHGHDPWVYYRDVLTRLPLILPTASDEELLTLLPHRWQPT